MFRKVLLSALALAGMVGCTAPYTNAVDRAALSGDIPTATESPVHAPMTWEDAPEYMEEMGAADPAESHDDERSPNLTGHELICGEFTQMNAEGNGCEVLPGYVVVPKEAIQEDSPWWDCHTMGNRVCG